MRRLDLRDIKNVWVYVAGFMVVLVSFMAQFSETVAAATRGIPCITFLGQPKMPETLLKQISE